MANAGNPVARGVQQAHHIVAQGARAAAPARAVLARVGIGINSARNGAAMRTAGHIITHTKEYYATINRAVISAEAGGVKAVTAALTAARKLLQGW
jgi:hypothetical protein